MTAALRIAIAACAMQLVACSNLLGLQDIVPDGSPYRLSFIGPPASVAVQEPLDLLAVRVEDVLGNPAQSPGMEIRLTLSANPGGASLLGTPTAKVGSDTALFDLVYLDKPGTGYTLVASANGLMPATMTFDVVSAFTHVSSGTDGGSVSGITSSPAPPGGSSTLFATAGNLVFTSTNGGMSWTPPGIGGSGGVGSSGGVFSVAGVVADPQHPGVAYALPPSGARYLFRKTTDGGMTWRAATIDGINLGKLTERTLAIAIDPANSSNLYVTTSVSSPTSPIKLHRSADGGMTWTTSSVPCESIAIDGATTSNLYCISGSSVLRSTDSGATWISANGSIDTRSRNSIFATPGALFAYLGGPLYRSIDHAMSWTPLSIASASALAFAPSMPQRVYLGLSGGSVRVSNDAGASFGPPVGSFPTVFQFTVDAQNPDLVYAATSGGVFKSSNAGVSWSPASTGIDVNTITAVVPVPRTPGAWLVSTPQSVVRTTNNGATWTQVASLFEAQLALDPANAMNVYACGQQFAASTDGGAHFLATSSVLCHSGGATGNLVASGNTVFSSSGNTPRKSIDRGMTWADVGGINPSTLVRGLAFGDTAGSVVLVGTSDGLFRSINGGTSFQRVNGDQVFGVFSDPNAPSHVYVETMNPCAFRYSTDGGSTFTTTLTTSIPSGCYDAYGMAGGTLYAGGYVTYNVAPPLIRSTDGGANWSAISSAGLPAGIMITSIAVADDGMTFLGTTGGLYRSSGH